jgi:hypothetical protein
MPAHSHNFFYQGTEYASWNWGLGSSAANTINFLGGTNAPGSSPISISSKGSTQAHNNLQPYLVINYIIKATAGWTAGDSELATRLGAVESAQATTNRSGLVPVVPASVGVGSGSSSVNSLGSVAFSGSSSVTLNGVFSNSYQNYRIVLVPTAASVNTRAHFRLASGGVASSTGNYVVIGSLVTANGGNTLYTGNNETRVLICDTHSGFITYSSAVLDLTSPFVASSNTQYHFTGVGVESSATVTRRVDGSGVHWITASYDGITIVPDSGTLSGTIQVYGYR